MTHTWFRLWDEVVEDPKVQKLPARLFKAWINLMCIASKNTSRRGALPEMSDVAYRLRVTIQRAEAIVGELVNARLFEWRDGVCYSHGWDDRQFQSDTSTERVKRFRNGRRNVPETVGPPKDGTDQSRTEQNRADTDTPKPPTTEDQILELGEHGHARMTKVHRERLTAKMNSHAEEYIRRFDEWVHQAPEAKHDGVKRKDRDAYASICSWFSRDTKEGKVKKAAGGGW